jgi:hypothetical protein
MRKARKPALQTRPVVGFVYMTQFVYPITH